ncbi:MAG: histidine phosphatase family protein [Candidatus Paceibacterota bacterium]|jgi:broad specificity phosphatase PhoE
MLKIYLARHGQDLDNASGILNGHRDQPLSEKGIEQAKETAEKIKETGIYFDYVYSSPLQRAYKTAEIITNIIGNKKPEPLADLIERDFGVMTGQQQKKIKEMCFPDIIETDTICYFLSPEGSETFPQLVARAKKLLISLKEKYTNGNILLVTHGDFGKMIYATYYNLDWKQVLMMFHFGNSELLELSEDSSAEEIHVFKIQQYNH